VTESPLTVSSAHGPRATARPLMVPLTRLDEISAKWLPHRLTRLPCPTGNRYASLRMPSSWGDVPERAKRKPTAPTRALPRSVHSINGGSPVADQITAVTTGARALATIVGREGAG